MSDPESSKPGKENSAAKTSPALGIDALTCKSSQEPTGTIVYSVCCPAKRPLTDYTARLVPSHAGASVPLEAGQILWQR